MTIALFSATSTLVINRVFNEKFISKTISNHFKADIPITIDGKEYDNVSEGFYGVLEQSLIEKTFDIEITYEIMDEIEDEIKESDIEDELRDEFFTDINLHNPSGKKYYVIGAGCPS